MTASLHSLRSATPTGHRTSRREERLRIAMIGQKGLPAAFGGVERHVEEVGARLAELGHEVTVYCRTTYTEAGLDTYRGMRLRSLPTVGTKHLDAIAHSAYSTLTAMRERHDVVHYHALGPGLVAPLPRFLSGARVVLTVHGLDDQRAKWGAAARAVLGTAHWMSARVPDTTVVVSRALARHYEERFDRSTVCIPNGVDTPPGRPADAITSRYGLTPDSYLLFVGRLVPEKAPDLLIRAYRRVPGGRRLVIAGDSSFTDEYVRELRELAAEDPRVIFVGYVYGDMLAELYSNASAFVLPSTVEGLPLALLEALSYGLPVVVSDIEPHREVGIDSHGYRLFPTGDEDALADTLRAVFAGAPYERAGAAAHQARIRTEYTWDAAARSLEEVYLRLAGRTVRQRASAPGRVRRVPSSPSRSARVPP